MYPKANVGLKGQYIGWKDKTLIKVYGSFPKTNKFGQVELETCLFCSHLSSMHNKTLCLSVGED